MLKWLAIESTHPKMPELTQFFQLGRHGLGAQRERGAGGSFGRWRRCGEKAWR